MNTAVHWEETRKMHYIHRLGNLSENTGWLKIAIPVLDSKSDCQTLLKL